jgi:hypothetical protein
MFALWLINCPNNRGSSQVESPQGRKPLGTRRQKSELVSSFCRLATPRLVPADLEPGADPERSEGARPNKK